MAVADAPRSPANALHPPGAPGSKRINRDIDFVTFYDTAMLNPRLRNVYEMLVTLQAECWEGAKILYGRDFCGRKTTVDENRKIEHATTVLETALASPAWQDYLRHREDQETQAAIETIPTTPPCDENPFGIIETKGSTMENEPKRLVVPRNLKLDAPSKLAIAAAIRSSRFR